MIPAPGPTVKDRPACRYRLCLAALASMLCASAPAHAHPLAPALLELREHAGGLVSVRFKTSSYAVPGAVELRPSLPAHCTRVGPSTWATADTGQIEEWRIRCDAREPLVGSQIGVLGLREHRIVALLRVEFADGRNLSRVLRAGAPTVRIPARPVRVDVATSYLQLGFRHIFSGLDHLLFVLGLVLYVQGFRSLLWTLTAFTLGHCATLSLAVLGWVRAPTDWIEVGIAMSVLLLAVRLARVLPEWRGEASARARRMSPGLAACFGLLHGLGFAGALAGAGLPGGEIPLALVSFNVGIELGQVAFVLAVVALGRATGAVWRALPARAVAIPVYAMGALAVYWCLDRGARAFF